MLELGSGEVSKLTNFETSKSPPVHFSICPSEQQIAYTDYREGQYELWVKPLQTGEPVRIASYASRDTLPIWHPDGERVFYSADHAGAYQVFVAYLDGRAPLQITVGGSDYLLSDVSPDGSKILTLSAREEADIWSLDIGTGRPREVITDAAIELWPRLSPTGQTIAYQTTGSREKIPNSSIVVKPVAGSAQPVRLTGKGYNFSWSPDGSKLAFLRFDDKVNLWMVSGTGGNEQQLTNEGVLIGGFIPLPCDRCQAEDFSWSPDGTRIIYSSRRSGVQNIWAVALGSGNYQVTDNTDPNLMLSSPLYSPDGSRIVYLSETRKAPPNDRKTWTIWLGDGSRSQAVCTSQSIMRIVGWSATGDSLIVASLEGKETYPVTASTVNLFRLDLGSGERQAIGRLSSAYFSSLRLSHDKTVVAFVSEQNEINGIWLAAADGGEPRMVLELTEPRSYICSLTWSPDDKAIYYVKQSSTSSISIIDNFR